MIKLKLSNKNENVENFPILSDFSGEIGVVWNVLTLGKSSQQTDSHGQYMGL